MVSFAIFNMKVKSQNVWAWTKLTAAKKSFSIFRWLHVYISTALFTLLVFFSITGITLNNPDWFKSSDMHKDYTLELPEDIKKIITDESPEIDTLKTHIQQTTGLIKPRSIDIEEGEISFDYPLPAGYAFVTLLADSSTMEIEYKKGSIIALLNDLHKGRHTAQAWSWLIDISAITIVILSLSGLIILLQHSKRRLRGLIMVVCGTLTPVLIFIAWVPSFGLK